jgi:sporulation protein YabP
MEEIGAGSRMHKIAMTNRRLCVINGVKDVQSFDVGEVRLETEQGMLQIKGEDLHVSRLTLERGEIDIDGRIDSMVYMDDGGMGSRKESFWERMFR